MSTRGPRPLPDDKNYMRRQREAGASIAAIAAETGYSRSAVHRIVRKVEGVDARAEANRRRAAIEPHWLPAVRMLIARGWTRHGAAKKLNIPTAMVYRALRKF